MDTGERAAALSLERRAMTLSRQVARLLAKLDDIEERMATLQRTLLTEVRLTH
jgi:hypothetical protein